MAAGPFNGGQLDRPEQLPAIIFQKTQQRRAVGDTGQVEDCRAVDGKKTVRGAKRIEQRMQLLRRRVGARLG